ncbi:MAG: branched-chain amino acid ABC transporter permease [Pseudonocardiaceae bacterium]|nr:branched-chain amino acid ABC transporter permease [Pseudonocardiaceae bacterium]
MTPRTTADAAPPSATAAPEPPRRLLRAAPMAATVVLLAAAPLFLAPYATTTLSRILVFALLAASLDLLVGITGLPSLGHAAYFGVGAYAAGWITIHLTPAVPVPLLAGAAFGGVAAAATGWFAVRSAGVFFLMLTLAIGEIVRQVAQSWDSVTGGSNGLYGIDLPSVAGAPLGNVGLLHWYVLAGAVLGYAVLRAVAASPFGAVLRGIRDNEPRMRALGYRPYGYKLAAFVIAGSVAGVAGALLAAQQRLVTPSDLGFTTAALALLAVVIGGAGTLWGPCLGAAVVVLVRDALGPTLDGHGPLLLGVVFIAVVYLLPRGAAGVRLRRGPGREQSEQEPT